MKLRLEEITPHLDEQGKVRAFIYRGRQYQVVQRLERWSYRGQWWLTPNLEGIRREYFRLQMRNVHNRRECCWEVFRSKEGWTLSRELD